MRRRRYSAKLAVVCTGEGTHPRERIASLLLDPIIEGEVRVGVVVEGATGTAGDRLTCPVCGRWMRADEPTLDALLDELVDEGRVTGQHDLSAPSA